MKKKMTNCYVKISTIILKREAIICKTLPLVAWTRRPTHASSSARNSIALARATRGTGVRRNNCPLRSQRRLRGALFALPQFESHTI